MISQHFHFTSGDQVWRILISDDDHLVIETRDTEKKTASFHAVDLHSTEYQFKNYQLSETYWVGIEKIYKGIIYFHKFTKPDMPGHKHIIAFDMKSQKILWETDKFSFYFIHDDKVYTYVQKFEGQHFYALDYKTGELIDDLGEDFQLANELRDKSGEDFSNYIFANQLHPEAEKYNADEKILLDKTKDYSLSGNIDYCKMNNLLLFNFHFRNSGKSFSNKFIIIDNGSGNEIYNDLLNEEVEMYVPDSFFCYKNYVTMIKEKKEIIVLKINEE
ncbi:MAG: DUF4905 domain-containing protein [Melioribacteraceae bacterium]|nr:DUF4905 domain-containing protein [Melioribacteraceae bacterium]MCF8356569.1 DUF4905 domain-containing protein [Melioribacteraceae bacterium]MCF8395929.1 DUF4905 domain-containing protein [Melioribacteraceae bacterium]MCF8421001.1 DUF4905 domain-containing protein [Melioribacteraceae bacterium]